MLAHSPLPGSTFWMKLWGCKQVSISIYEILFKISYALFGLVIGMLVGFGKQMWNLSSESLRSPISSISSSVSAPPYHRSSTLQHRLQVILSNRRTVDRHCCRHDEVLSHDHGEMIRHSGHLSRRRPFFNQSKLFTEIEQSRSTV